MDTALLRSELIGEAVAHALDEERGGLNHFETNMARGNDLNDEILVEGALLGLTEEYTGLGDVAVASALALRATRDAGGRLTCFSARVDLRSCADGVCDRHDFGAPRGLGGMSFFIRRCGEVLCDNPRGHLGNALYAHCIRIENAADHDEMIKRTKDALNYHTLSNLRSQATAAGIRDDEPRFAIYVGRVEDGPDSGAWPRNLKHEDGTSGATRFCSFIGELELRPLYTRARRLLAIGANTRTGCKLEASGAQYCGVGRGHPFNDAHAGVWRYAVGDGHRDDLFVFLPLLCEALDDAARWRADCPAGVEAATHLADGPFAVDAFDSRDGFLAATPRQILSALSNRSHARVADVRAKFQARGIVTGVKYCRSVVPVDSRLYAFILAQAREELRRLHPDAPLDVQRALVVGVYTDVLEAARFDDLASAAARAASSNAADFEALRKHDADLLSRTRAIPQFSKFNAQCRALEAQLEAAGFGVQGWAPKTAPEDTPFFCYQAARAREAARERFGDDASKLRAAFAKIRTIFREAADFEDDAYVDTCDAAAFDALAAADADVVDRRRPGGKGAMFPKKLAELVRQHADVVSWNATTHELVIDQARLEREVLPLYFKMRDFDSFRSQLANYGFSKVNQSAKYGSRPKVSVIYSNTAVADLTKLVRRKSTPRPAPAPAPAPKPPPALKFPGKLADIVARHVDVVSWDATAGKLVIVNQARFEREVMPRYFKAREYTSFERQLQYHGFSKVVMSAARRAAGELVYSNNTADADLTKLVKRKSTSQPAPAPAPKRPGTARQASMRAARAEKEQARAPSPVPAPSVQLDDDDNAAPWFGPAPELGGEEAQPEDAPVAPPSAPQPVAAVAALPFGTGAAADARVPFGGALPALPALHVAVEVEAACAAPALDETLEAPAWAPPPPPPPTEPDAGALALMLAAIDDQSRQAAAAPAPVVAAPALVSPVAASASTKRPRAASPVEEDVDGAEPKRARRELVAADPLASSAVCIALVGGAGAMAFWPKIVEAGLDDAQKLVGADADAALAGFGLSPAQRSIIRDGLAAVGFQ